MRISKFLSAVCLAVVLANVCVRAADSETQAAARAALLQKMNELDGGQPSQPSQTQTQAPPVVVIPQPTPQETNVVETSMTPPPAATAPETNPPAMPTAETLPPAVAITNEAVPEIPMTNEPAIPVAAVTDEPAPPVATMTNEPVPSIVEMTNETVQPVAAMTNEIVPPVATMINEPAPAVTETAAAPAVVEQSSTVTNATPPPIEVIPLPPTAPTPVTTIPTDNTNVSDADAQAKARSNLMQTMQSSPDSTSSARPNGQTMTMSPIEAPPLPISAAKQSQLQALLEQYKADQITPSQYQAERARILSQP